MALVDAQLTTFAESEGVPPDHLASVLQEVLDRRADGDDDDACPHADRFMRMFLAALEFEAFVRLERNVAFHLQLVSGAASSTEGEEEYEGNGARIAKTWPVGQWLTYSACDLTSMMLGGTEAGGGGYSY